MDTTYTLTADQLTRLIHGACNDFYHHLEPRGDNKDYAKARAVKEAIKVLNKEQADFIKTHQNPVDARQVLAG